MLNKFPKPRSEGADSSPPQPQPVAFRLPPPGQGDPYFGMTRSHYFQLEKRGQLRMTRIIGPGKKRGVTLIPYAAVLDLVTKGAGE